MSSGTWFCSKCRHEKPLAAFLIRASGRPASLCGPCQTEYHREWRKKNRDKPRQYQLRSQFGLTPEDIEEIVRKQDGKCPTCLEPLPKGRKRHVDHRHSDGQVRGVLCSNCNMALGMVHERQETLLRLADYLEPEVNGVRPVGVSGIPDPVTSAHRIRADELFIVKTGGSRVRAERRPCAQCSMEFLAVRNETMRFCSKECGNQSRRLDETCRRGHPRTPENTYVYDKKRACKVCRRAVYDAYLARRKIWEAEAA